MLAPHPDDDVITSAGVIYRARQAGTVVWVMYMTNGDYAPMGTAWGYAREDEAVSAQALLGVPEDNLVFLGYPDGSLQSLYGAFFNTPYVPTEHGYQGDRAILEAMSDVAYARRGHGRTDYHHHAFGSAAANMGANVQADLAHFLANRRPTDIYTVGRCDRHPDHAHTYEFLMSALQQVRASSPSYDPYVWQTVVWAGFNVAETDPPDPNPPDADDWPLAPNPATLFTEPVRVAACLSANSLEWSQRQSLAVPAPMLAANFEQNLKAQAIEQHVTQGGFNPVSVRNRNDGHISAFVHRDEFFYRFRASGSPRALDGGARPFPVDAGVDAGVADSGTSVDAASGALDGAAGEGGEALADGAVAADGSAPLEADAGAPDARVEVPDAAAAQDAQPAMQDGSLDGGTSTGAAPDGGAVSEPWDEDVDQSMDDPIMADGVKRGDDSGCSLRTTGAPFGAQLGLAVLGALAALLLRRHTRGMDRPSARRDRGALR